MKILVIAPHPDDEILGCGGTMLRYASEGKTIGWLILTSMKEEDGWSLDQINKRNQEIINVRTRLGIEESNLFSLGFTPASLDALPLSELVQRISTVLRDFQAEEIYLPHHSDVHSDHRVCFDAVMSSTKWFRYPSLNRILTYETLSETDTILDQNSLFNPTVFVDISDTLSLKWDLMKVYESEIGQHPFPRSEKAINALAWYRGSQSGFEAAEAFCLLKERIPHEGSK